MLLQLAAFGCSCATSLHLSCVRAPNKYTYWAGWHAACSFATLGHGCSPEYSSWPTQPSICSVWSSSPRPFALAHLTVAVTARQVYLVCVLISCVWWEEWMCVLSNWLVVLCCVTLFAVLHNHAYTWYFLWLLGANCIEPVQV